MNLVIRVKVLVSPPPISVLTTQTELTEVYWQPATFQKIWGKKPKALTKVTLYEPPIKVNAYKYMKMSFIQ